MDLSKILTSILINLLFVSCEDDDVSPRIVGGYDCPPESFPFAVAVYSNSLCGGSLIAASWVLTAGHCVKDTTIKAGQTRLRIGYQHKSSVQERIAIESAVHPKFDHSRLSGPAPELRYDIALLLAQKPFKLDKPLRLTKMPKAGFTKTCKMATVAGIGIETARSFDFENNILKCVDLPIVGSKTCSRTWQKSTVDDSVVCTMEEEGGKDACQGDSGGPLVCNDVLIGVVSMGRGCARPGLSGTYTSVEYHMKWINSVMSQITRTKEEEKKDEQNNTTTTSASTTSSNQIIQPQKVIIVITLVLLLIYNNLIHS